MDNNVCVENSFKSLFMKEVAHSSDGFGYGLLGMLFIRITEGIEWVEWGDVFRDFQGAIIASVTGFFTVMLLKFIEKKIKRYARLLKEKFDKHKRKP